MRKYCFVLGLILIVAFVSTQALAFDGDRKGFMLNLGAGFGQGKVSYSDANGSQSLDGTGFSTDFKIGAGLSPQAVLYYTNRVVWWSDGFSWTTGMSAVGFSYFLKPEAPSFFFSGSLGLGVASIESSASDTGFGFGLGVGFEFTRNWTVEASFLSAKVAEEGDESLTASNFALTISWFAY